jgi:hypothetical protein
MQEGPDSFWMTTFAPRSLARVLTRNTTPLAATILSIALLCSPSTVR